jgi:subtilisin family serine protease
MRKHLLWTLALLGLLAACNQNAVRPPQNPNPTLASGENLTYIQNEVVVAYQDEAALQEAIRKLGATEIARIPELRAALLRVPGDALKASKALKGLPGLRYAEPHLAMALAPKDDPVVQRRAGGGGLAPLGNPPDQISDELPQYALDPRHLNARPAWDRGFFGEGVTVAIIDDPADVTHPDLAANWAGLAYDPVTDTTYTEASSWTAFIQDFFQRFDPSNFYHGTFVASTVSAAKDGRGIVGLAPRTKFLRVLPHSSTPAILSKTRLRMRL